MKTDRLFIVVATLAVSIASIGNIGFAVGLGVFAVNNYQQSHALGVLCSVPFVLWSAFIGWLFYIGINDFKTFRQRKKQYRLEWLIRGEELQREIDIIKQMEFIQSKK